MTELSKKAVYAAINQAYKEGMLITVHNSEDAHKNYLMVERVIEEYLNELEGV